MSTSKSRQKSPSISSLDSGLGHSTKKKSMNKSSSGINQQLLQAANLTAKTQLLKRGLMNSNAKVKEFMSTNSESDSDSNEPEGGYSKNSKQSTVGTLKSKQISSSDSEDEETVIMPSFSNKSRPSYSNKSSDSEDEETVIMPTYSNKSRPSYSNNSSDSEDDETEVPESAPNKSRPNNTSRPSNNNGSSKNSSSATDSDSSEAVAVQKPHQQVQGKAVDILKNFLDDHPDYKGVNIPEKSDLSQIDSDDEIYILKIPKDVNPQIMQGVKFSLSKKSKLRTEEGKYIIKPSDEPSSHLVYSNLLKRINPVTTLVMEKYQKKERKQDNIEEEEKNNQPVPKNLKVRHPFFGPDYQSRIELDKQIKDKLQQALNRHKIKTEVKRERVEEDFTFFNQSKDKSGSGESKKKKKKNHLEANSIKLEVKRELEDELDFNMLTQTKTKKKKNKNKEPKEELEMAIENTIEGTDGVESKKKKKRNKESESFEQQLQLSIKKEIIEESPKPKKRRKSVMSSTMIHDFGDTPDLKIDVSHIKTEKLFSKKIKTSDNVESDKSNNDLISSLLSSVKDSLERTKTKKKHKNKKES